MIATAYDHDGNRTVQIDLRVGDEVEWKKNGLPGTVRCKVISMTSTRVKIRGIATYVVKPQFLSIYRDGRRLP